MRILLLADSNSIHTIRWAKAISKSGIEIAIFSIHVISENLYHDEKIKLYSFKLSRKYQFDKEVSPKKLSYAFAIPRLKKVIAEFSPDILHAHYASSYGLLGSLSGFHPFIISVWGSDIYNFPYQSVFHSALIRFNLSRADILLSTSKSMAEQTKKFSKKRILVTPFGIDTKVFFPKQVKGVFATGNLVIGTIKTLEKKYGIEFLIRAFYSLKSKKSNIRLKLLIVGQGSQEKYLKELVNDLGINDDTFFAGFIEKEKLPEYHNMIDIYVAVSTEDSESFGVAVLEACACSKPVIVSDAGGLPEVVENGVTGLVVRRLDLNGLTEALDLLIKDTKLRENLGINGRKHVLENYQWNDSVDKMLNIYRSILKNK